MFDEGAVFREFKIENFIPISLMNSTRMLPLSIGRKYSKPDK